MSAMTQDQIDAARWRALVTRTEIFRVNDFESGVIFQVAAGTNWEHKTVTEAIDSMLANPGVACGEGDQGNEA